MATKKSNKARSTGKSPALAKATAPKAPSGGSPIPPSKLSWAARQARIVVRLKRTSEQLLARLVKDAASGAPLDPAREVLRNLSILEQGLSGEAIQSYRPAALGRVLIGSKIVVRADEETRGSSFFSAVSPTTGRPMFSVEQFDHATVIGEDRFNYQVERRDGTACMIQKKFVQLAPTA